nr:MAG TPA: hypothetical protein [Microviridae sp.]
MLIQLTLIHDHALRAWGRGQPFSERLAAQTVREQKLASLGMYKGKHYMLSVRSTAELVSLYSLQESSNS